MANSTQTGLKAHELPCWVLIEELSGCLGRKVYFPSLFSSVIHSRKHGWVCVRLNKPPCCPSFQHFPPFCSGFFLQMKVISLFKTTQNPLIFALHSTYLLKSLFFISSWTYQISVRIAPFPSFFHSHAQTYLFSFHHHNELLSSDLPMTPTPTPKTPSILDFLKFFAASYTVDHRQHHHLLPVKILATNTGGAVTLCQALDWALFMHYLI